MKDKNKMIVVACNSVTKNMISTFYGEEYRFIFTASIMDSVAEPTGYTSRMAGFFLYVSNTTIKEHRYICFHELQNVVGTPLLDQRINCPIHGRYVIYYNERRMGFDYPSYYSKSAYYELCELEVYGEFTMIKISNKKLF